MPLLTLVAAVVILDILAHWFGVDFPRRPQPTTLRLVTTTGPAGLSADPTTRGRVPPGPLPVLPNGPARWTGMVTRESHTSAAHNLGSGRQVDDPLATIGYRSGRRTTHGPR
jgi:hypothetical protein